MLRRFCLCSFGVARWPKPSLRFAFCPSVAPLFRCRRRRNPVKISFAKKHFHRGSQMAKTLTSFRVLPFGRSVIPMPKAEESSQGLIREKSIFIGVARWPKPSLRFAFCPSGLLELRPSQGQNPSCSLRSRRILSN